MIFLIVLLFILSFFLLKPSRCEAHCDTMDGPVLQAARKALETKNINLILIWVQPEKEAEIQNIFLKTLNMRELSPEAREFADNYFFETVVRIHRAGEGAPYTGLKPAGLKLSPAITAADQAIINGQAKSLQEMIYHSVIEGIKEKFNSVLYHKNFDPNNIEAGREFVKSYIEFVHYAERIYQATSTTIHGHFHED